jgi:hypothetical protein
MSNFAQTTAEKAKKKPTQIEKELDYPDIDLAKAHGSESTFVRTYSHSFLSENDRALPIRRPSVGTGQIL